ncbi:uncharacterized protein LOC113758039 [Coffea eugenioides]|uniref:uncharacterized protein LOC113758039 n=1 Tax=Coffea eugenioides TaxID=49369 RepID=UPI000F611E9A|nr:uncharacterized protein LOC113758039 [Coffea eugenioides]
MLDNYLLTQELIADIGKKCRGWNVVLKLDMAKAYDRMSWVFILKVLRQFGFRERFIDMVWRLLSNVWFSVIVNDAVIVFANGSASSLRKVMRVLELYQGASGQLVNTSKSGFLIHPSVSVARKSVIEQVTKFSKREFPVRYLGSPLFTDRCKGAYFADLCQQIVDKVLSWKNHLLSSGGKIILIKHMLSNIPLHLLVSAILPKSSFRMIEQVCANFLNGISSWALFLWAKYCHNSHPCQVSMISTSSATWHRILDIRGFAELFITWRPYSGNCHFWYDNWMGLGAFYLRVEVQEHLSFQNFVTDVDRIVWTASSSGRFSVSSAFHELREAKPSSFMFRQHVFMESEVARTVWKVFGSLCGLPFSHDHFRVYLVNWWCKLTKSARLKLVFCLLHAFVCWNLWKARNSAVLEGSTTDVRSICGAVFQNLKDAYWLQFGEFQQVATWPQFLGLVEQRLEVFRIHLVHWHPLVLGKFKLN